MFTLEEFAEFADDMGIKLYNSSPYYAQANGQAEASNHILIKIIKKKIEEQPRKWYLTCHGSTKATPYELVYGHAAVLPWESQTGSRCIALQDDLTADNYKELMMDGLEDLHCHRLKALENIENNKLKVAKQYNKKVRDKHFEEGELVWKLRLPIGTKDNKFGKWSPS
jgi:hypothetical protein